MRIFRYWLFILVLVLNINLSIAKQVTFEGKVIDDNGNPIDGAKAELYDFRYGDLEYSYNLEGIIEQTSDAKGVFTFNQEFPGDNYSYKIIVVKKDGYAIDSFNWDAGNRNARNKGEFKLSTPMAIRGTIVDESDIPIADSSVSILMMRIGEPDDWHELNINVASKLFKTTTDENGKFTFTNLPSNTAVAFLVQKEGRATISSYVPGTPASEHLKYSPGQENIKIVQPEESKIEGIAIDTSSGKPLAEIPLMLRGMNNNQVIGQDIIKTDENGKFIISGICAGTYNIICVPPRIETADWLSQPSNFKLETGQTVQNMKVELIKGGLLDVLVTESGTNKFIEGATVIVYNSQRTRSFAKKTDKEGIARIRLLPGVYELGQVFGSGYSIFIAQNILTIEQGSTKRQEVELSPTPTASGVVHDENGKPIEGVVFKVLPGFSDEAVSDENGKFEISWEIDGLFDEPTANLLICRYEKANLAKVVILEGNTENLDIKLEPGITLTGKVTTPEGKGIGKAGIGIMLRGSMWASTLIRGDIMKTDADGNIEVKAIPSGYSYEMCIIADGYGSQRKQIQADDAINNILDSGTFILPVANLSVSGVVVDVEGNPIPYARIESYNREGGQPESLNTQADENGKFVLEGVCEGDVDLRVTATLNENRVSARGIAEGGTSGIKIIAKERGEYVTQRFTNKTPEQLIEKNEIVIAGIVVDENDSPIANVPVVVNCIKREREDIPGKYYWAFSAYENLSSVTDEQGRFVIVLEEDNVQYDLLFSAYYFAPMIVYDIPSGKKDVKVVLDKGGTISGKLVRMDGNGKIPIPNVEIKLEQTSRASYTHLGFDQDQRVTTDSEGRFKFEHIRTKIRPNESMSKSEWEYLPRVWQLVYGDEIRTFAFYDRTVIEDFEFIIGNDTSSIKQLAGSILPDFEGINIDYDIEQAKDKRILLCYFDIEQRPSRSCMLELSKKADELKENNIEVVLIHASKIEKEYLDNWLQENEIKFPVGTIETNTDQIKSDWGVKALPWLIITDKEHVVTDEGFSINDLEENIQD